MMWFDYLLLVLSMAWLHDVCSGPYTTSDRLLVFAWSELCAGYICARINSDHIARRFSQIVTKAKLAATTTAAEDATPDPRDSFLVRHLPGRRAEQSIIEWIFALVLSFTFSGGNDLQAVAPVENGADIPSPPEKPLQTDGLTSTPPLPPPLTEELLLDDAAKPTLGPNGEDGTASEEVSVGTTKDEETVKQPNEVREEEEFDEAKALLEMLDTVEEGDKARTRDVRRAMERMMERNRRSRELLAPTKPEEIEAENRAPRSAQASLVLSTPATGSPVARIRGTYLRDRQLDADNRIPRPNPIPRVLRHRFERVTRPVDGITTATTTTVRLDDQHTVRKIDSNAPVDTAVATITTTTAAAAINSSSSLSSITEDVTKDDEDAARSVTTTPIASISSPPTEDIVADNDNGAVRHTSAITNTSISPSAFPIASILITANRCAAGRKDKKDKKNVGPSTPDMPSPRAISFSDQNTVHLYDKTAPPSQRSESRISRVSPASDDDVGLIRNSSILADDVFTESIITPNTPDLRGFEKPQLPGPPRAPMDVDVDVDVKLPVLPNISTHEEALDQPISFTAQDSSACLPVLQAQRTFTQLPISSPVAKEEITYLAPMQMEPPTEHQSTDAMIVEHGSDPPGFGEFHASGNLNFASSIFIYSQDFGPSVNNKSEMDVEDMTVMADPTPDVQELAQISLPAMDTAMDESRTLPINAASAVELSARDSKPTMDVDMDENPEICTQPASFESPLTEQNGMKISTPAAITASASSAQAPMNTAMTVEKTMIPALIAPVTVEETTKPASTIPLTLENLRRVNALSSGAPTVPRPFSKANSVSNSESMTTTYAAVQSPHLLARINMMSDPRLKRREPTILLPNKRKGKGKAFKNSMEEKSQTGSMLGNVDMSSEIGPENKEYQVAGQDSSLTIHPTEVDRVKRKATEMDDPDDGEGQELGQDKSKQKATTIVDLDDGGYQETGLSSSSDIHSVQEDKGKRKAIDMDGLDDGECQESGQGSSSNEINEPEDSSVQSIDPSLNRKIRAATTSRRSKWSEQQRIPMHTSLQVMNKPIEAEPSSPASKRLMSSGSRDAGQVLFATPKNDDLSKLLRQTTRISRNLPSASTLEVSEDEAADLMRSVSNASAMPLRPPKLSSRSSPSLASSLSRPQNPNIQRSSSSTSPLGTGNARVEQRQLGVTSLWPGDTREEFEDQWLTSMNYLQSTIARVRKKYLDLNRWHFPSCAGVSLGQNPKPLSIPRSLLAYAERHFDGTWRQLIEEEELTPYKVYESYRQFIQSELLSPRETTRDKW